MSALDLEDRRHLDAVEGWLGLGGWQEAKAELDCISPPMREHPTVLAMRWNIHAAAKQWEAAAEVARTLSRRVPYLPTGWLELAHALHALKRTQEARDTLLPMLKRFPGEYFIPYKLACYACQLGRLEEARHWLGEALQLAGGDLVRTALNDPELKPFWLQTGSHTASN